MYERILVPLDGSKLGEAALPYVEELVSRLCPEVKVEVTLLEVVPLLVRSVVEVDGSLSVPYTDKQMEPFKQAARNYLNKTGEGLRSKGATVKTKVGVGNAAEEILEVSDEANVSLIAMSTHGRGGISRWAFGSVADKVLHGAKVPVLLVRASE